ncbi:MAG: tripartite tricarboxylate transporter substrate binding protein [Xanthobacteraceae bacterium]|jgi:tripartite-type tricarboxylate transporter receptor subunit TctC
MNIARRHFLNLAAGAVAMPAVSRMAHADTYPSRAVHLIVPQAAASSTDIHARLIGQFLQDHLGQAFVVDVKPGAGGNVGTEFVVHAAPDGYTLLTVNSQNAISPSLYPELTFNFLRDIAPIGQISLAPMIMEVNPAVPANTVPEFIAYAKANPGKISMASAGVGGPQHLAGELFKSMTGLNLVHVPYRGSTPAITDMLAGQVQLMFDVTPTALPQVKAGKLRALAVTTKARLDALPDIPSLSDYLPGYEAEGWLGMGAPTGTPQAIIGTLNKQINDALADDKIKQRLTDIGVVVHGGSPADFGKFIASETAKWGKVIKEAGIKPD